MTRKRRSRSRLQTKMDLKRRAEAPMVTAAAWYRKAQWDRLLEVSTDRDKLEDTYEEWVETAEDAIRRLRRQGVTIVKVDVDVEELLAWCQAQSRPVDGEARAEYAATRLRERRHGRDET